MPPQANAQLTRVTSATAATGGRDQWDSAVAGAPTEPTGAGAAKWTGIADAYYSERVDRTPGDAGAVDVIVHHVLYIDSAVARAAGIDTDDVLTFTDPTGATRTARASSVAIRELPGIPPSLQTARLELELA